ncbi:MAPEG family protein [Ruegeria sp. WL0004]|uniref:MAPEG family protein n=1 Tax=Ruegeria marisflavi TaxID=2984152 RepID=A0ABT2WPN2_9RHOB|nr:MAPEG family protein [Ruegeria sp. WL0004]MCU9837839.1 MAPEG family protein [Ruegeria sp. WL0004]
MKESFPTELGILTCLMILAASLWIPYVVGIATDPSHEEAFARPAQISNLRPWVQRAHRAHLNLLEQATPFAVLVLILALMNGFSTLTYWTAIAFFWIRVVHAAGMISGYARMPLRPILFSAGWVCTLMMAYAIFAAR